MAAPSPKNHRSSTLARALGIIFSTMVHVAIVSGLLWQMRWRPVEQASGAMQVELSKPLGAQRRVNKALPTRSRKPARNSPPPMARGAPAAVSPTPPQTIIAPLEPSVPPIPPGLSQALRRSLGCTRADYYGLTSSEREECQRRAAELARAGTAGPYYGLSPEKQAAFDAAAKRADFLQQPFLAERPKKGCKPTVTEHEEGVFGRAPPNWTASVACAIRF